MWTKPLKKMRNRVRLKSIFIYAAFPVTVSGISDFLDGKNNGLVNSQINNRAVVEYYLSGYSDSFPETIKHIKEKPPDLLLIDDSFLEQEKVFYFINDISRHSGKSKIIIYTGSNDYRYLERLIKLGIRSVPHKKMKRKEFMEALRAIAESGRHIDEHIRNILIKGKVLSGVWPREEKTERLTKREKEVIDYIMEGLTRQEISVVMNISEKTVSQHIENIKLKFGIKSTRELRKKLRIIALNSSI